MNALRIVAPPDTLVADLEDQGKRHGLELITDGYELKYVQRGAPLPPGHHRFALVAKNAASPLAPKVPRL